VICLIFVSEMELFSLLTLIEVAIGGRED